MNKFLWATTANFVGMLLVLTMNDLSDEHPGNPLRTMEERVKRLEDGQMVLENQMKDCENCMNAWVPHWPRPVPEAVVVGEVPAIQEEDVLVLTKAVAFWILLGAFLLGCLVDRIVLWFVLLSKPEKSMADRPSSFE